MKEEIPFCEENKTTYFEGYESLHDITENSLLELHYLRPSTNNFMSEMIGYRSGLMNLTEDEEMKKSFPIFFGENGVDGLIRYLHNTTHVTMLGIGFAYLMKIFGDGVIGIIKVTSPAHNRVTNNFNHWLIDFIVNPYYRKQGFATFSVKLVLGVVQKMGAKEIFAMVDCENHASIRVLEKCDFYETHLFDIGFNRHTGNKCLLYRKIF